MYYKCYFKKLFLAFSLGVVMAIELMPFGCLRRKEDYKIKGKIENEYNQVFLSSFFVMRSDRNLVELVSFFEMYTSQLGKMQ